MSLSTSSNGLNEVKQSMEGSFESAKKTLEGAAHDASKGLAKVEKAAIANPLVTAGLLVGAGALLGALLHAALRPAPSAGELILRSLKDNAARTGETLSSGFSRARHAMR